MGFARRSPFASGYVALQDDCQLEGTISHNLMIMGPATVTINGTLTENLTIMPGATVILRGSVGNVSNRGGTLYVYGAITGALALQGGKTTIDAAARIERITPHQARYLRSEHPRPALSLH